MKFAAVFALLAGLLVVQPAFAEEGSGMAGAAVQAVPTPEQAVAASGDMAETTAEPTPEAEAVNKICPLSGKEVTSMGAPHVVEHNGKKYNLCCPMCESAFQADADKYAMLVEEQLKSAAAMETEEAASAEEPQPEAAEQK